MRTRLKELFKKIEYTPFPEMTMKSNLGNQFTDYALDCIIDKIFEDGWIKSPCKEGETIYKIRKFCGENTGYNEFYRPTIEFEEDCPHFEHASWYDDCDVCTASEDYDEGCYCNLYLKVLNEACKCRFAIQKDKFTFAKMKQIYGTPMFDESIELRDRYYLSMEDAEKALEEIRNETLD